MPNPSDLANSSQLRIVRRRTIAVAVFYAIAALALAYAATLTPASPTIAGEPDILVSQRN
jgi:hypothetical protein